MRIGIIGAGSVGSTLARAWASRGHQVALATRNPDDPKLATLALSIGPNATAAAVPKAVEHSEVVVLAMPWIAVRDMPGVAADWSGKIVIDCTNPLRPDGKWLEDGYQISGAERVAAWAEGASVFKTLNHTGYNNMANPIYPKGRAVMFVCGDDEAAMPTVLHLVSSASMPWMPEGSRWHACSSRSPCCGSVSPRPGGSGPRSRSPCCAGRRRPADRPAA